MACSTTFLRSRARLGELNGDHVNGACIVPAMVAASASDTLVTSLPNISREASATPWIANDPR